MLATDHELAESNDSKQITFKDCDAYGIILQPAEESHDYDVIALQPLPGPCPVPTQSRGPTSSLQRNVAYDHTCTLQDHRAVGSGQARSTAPSHSPPQELGGDEHLYEPTWDPTSTATPTAVAPGDAEYKEQDGGPVAAVPQDK